MSRGPADPRLLRLPRVRRYALSVAASGVLTALRSLVQAGALAQFVAGAVDGRLDRVALLTLLLAIGLRALLHLSTGVLAARTAAGVKRDLRAAVLAAASTRGPAYLAGKRTGELSTVVSRGVDALDAYLKIGRASWRERV